MKSIRVATPDEVELHVATCGSGPDVVVLSGGPGCVHYLADEQLAPSGYRCWFPDPRGVDQSGGGPHDMTQAIADLEAIREAIGIEDWIVLGHSWGSDLGVRYAVDHPHRVKGLVGIAGHGLHRDRDWSAVYEAGKATDNAPEIDYVPEVHASLWTSFRDWIHEPTLWRSLADSPVPMALVVAADDIRPSWPVEQLAELVPAGSLTVDPGVPHDFWHTDPQLWKEVCAAACAQVVDNELVDRFGA